MLNSPAFIGRIGRANRGSLLLYPTYVQDYLDRVTAADVAAGDTAGLERGVTDAFNQALQGMVSDQVLGISGGVIAQAPSIIKAMPFMVGARTLSGCLVPVVGPAPTSYNFVPPDYDRKTGLLGDGATTYLDSNRDNNVDPQDSQSIGVHITALPSDTTRKSLIGCGVGNDGSSQLNTLSYIESRSRSSAASQNAALATSLGFAGLSRSSSANYVVRHAGSEVVVTEASQAPLNETINIYRRGAGSPNFTNARLAFYFIGEAINLALLDARVTALITAIADALP